MKYPNKPELFFGTMMPLDKTYDAMMNAFRAGYKYFDFADRYDNQKEIGKAINDWFEQNPKEKREDYFFQTKVWTTDIEANDVRRAVANMLIDLHLDYIDCLLIHRPSLNFFATLNAWKEFISLKEQDIVHNIGVSNFDKDQILYLWKKTGVKPICNQIEFNVKNQRWDRVQFCSTHNIALQAYSPLSHAFEIKEILELSEQKSSSITGVIIGWLMFNMISPILKSETPKHIFDNIDVKDTELTQQDIVKIFNLNIFDNTFAETFDNLELSEMIEEVRQK